MGLCSQCSKIKFPLTPTLQNVVDPPIRLPLGSRIGGTGTFPKHWTLLPNGHVVAGPTSGKRIVAICIPLCKGSDLPTSAATCDLCSLIHEGLAHAVLSQDASTEPAHQDLRLLHGPIYCCFWNNPYLYPHCSGSFSKVPTANRQAYHVTEMHVFIPLRDVPQDYMRIKFHCFAKEGSLPARNRDIVGLPPISGIDGKELQRRTESWLSLCESEGAYGEHSKCKRSAAGYLLASQYPSGEKAPRLPTRVIEVGSEGSYPRLIQSSGMTGRYFALSHCWGPPDKRPLTTTKETLAIRRAGIPFDVLPKSFQDAIKVTRAQGIRFLWIDSLCILQDDFEDWEREAKQMADVYEQAVAVIVAAEASNSHEGLFMGRPTNSAPVELSYHGMAGERLDSFFVWLDRLPTEPDPWKSPLYQRGWAMQEWQLSRRRIFFARNGVHWECQQHSHNERGHCSTITVDGPEYWDHFTQYYSAKKFTYLTDRLIALEGLRSRYPHGSSKHDKRYCFGMWTDRLPQDLLWKTKGVANRVQNPLRVPSWSWASVLCPIEYLEFRGSFDVLSTQLSVGEPGLIEMTTTVTPAPRILSLDRSANADDTQTGPGSRRITCRMLGVDPKSIRDDVKFVLYDEERKLAGHAFLDEEQLPAPSDDLFCLRIVGNEPENITDESVHRVLLVRQFKSEGSKFSRVGVAVVWASCLKASQQRQIFLE